MERQLQQSNKISVGERLRWLRERHGLTQQELAEKSGINRVTISKIESGHVEPRAKTLTRLLEAIGVELSTFWEGTREPVYQYETSSEERYYEPVQDQEIPPALAEMLDNEENRLRYGITDAEEAMLRSIRTRSSRPMTREFFEEVLIAYRRYR